MKCAPTPPPHRPLRQWALHAICAPVGLLLLLGPASAPAEPASNIDQAYAVRGVPRAPFDANAAGLQPHEGRFLEQFFAVTDEAVALNADTLRWFASDGREGLHFLDYREQLDALRARLGALDTPSGGAEPPALVNQALQQQSGFFADWYAARSAGRTFESQLTHEYAWHPAPQRARAKLLRAYAELRGLFPGAGEATQRAFHAHLRALDLGP